MGRVLPCPSAVMFEKGGISMAIRRMPAALFVARLLERWAAGDGYIMCATGQNPKKWSKGRY